MIQVERHDQWPSVPVDLGQDDAAVVLNTASIGIADRKQPVAQPRPLPLRRSPDQIASTTARAGYGNAVADPGRLLVFSGMGSSSRKPYLFERSSHVFQLIRPLLRVQVAAPKSLLNPGDSRAKLIGQISAGLRCALQGCFCLVQALFGLLHAYCQIVLLELHRRMLKLLSCGIQLLAELV